MLPGGARRLTARPRCPGLVRSRGTGAERYFQACALISLPSCVCPVRALIGDGTINCISANSPRQSSRGCVANRELLLPTHKSGLPGNSRSMISSACDSASAKRTGDASHRSTRPSPVAVTASRCSAFTCGHAGARVTVTRWPGFQATPRCVLPRVRSRRV